MLTRLAQFVLRHRVATLVLSGLFVVCAALLILRGGHLTSGAFRGTEHERAHALAAEVTGHPTETLFVAIFEPARPGQSAEEVDAALERAVEPLRHDDRVAGVMTPASAPSFLRSRLVDQQGTTRLALVTLKGDSAEARKAYGAVRPTLSSPDANITCTGFLPFLHDMNTTLEHDLQRAELIALPLALLVLLLVFRTAVAAALPVGVGGIAVLGGVGLVLGASHLTDVSMYAINVCSLIGLGVSIDYSLFLVSRYREELDAGRTRDGAIIRAVETAGHTVLFSGLAVCVGLGGLLFFGGSYLRPMGIAGMGVVTLAVIFSLTFLPALLSVLGDRIGLGRLPLPAPRKRRDTWGRIARSVMRRPIAVALPIFLLLTAMGLPFLHLKLAAADVTVLDREIEARRGYELLQERLPEQAKNRVLIAVEFPTSPALTPERITALYDLSHRVKALPGVTGVDSLFAGDGMVGRDDLPRYLLDPPPLFASMVEEGKAMSVRDRTVLLYATTDAAATSETAREVVRAIRADRRVGDGQLAVGGDTARDLDATAFIASRAPRAIAFVFGATLILLFLLLRSVVLPFAAALMNVVSMAGSFGALVWIFQDGHLGIAEPRPLEPTLPVLLFCVLFGLSMYYQVLLLSRIREAYVRTKNDAAAITEGVQRTASLVTSAAAIMIAVFIAFSSADVVMVRAVGVGMALAVFLDATLVRTLLVPATMRLLGRLNWWTPFRRAEPRPPPPTPPSHAEPATS